MSAPDPSLVVENPPPLNAFRRFPFRIDEFPAAALGNLAPHEEPVSAPADVARLEQR